MVSKTDSSQKTWRILTSDDLNLSDTMAVSEDDTDLRWSSTLSCKFADVVDHGLGGALEPGRNGSRVWDGRGADTLSLAVKTTHDCGCGVVEKPVVVVVGRSRCSSIRNFYNDCGIEVEPAFFDAKISSWHG